MRLTRRSLLALALLGAPAAALIRHLSKERRTYPEQQRALVYLAHGERPDINVRRLVASLGGIDRFVGKDDLVIIKPNAQWWHQGTTNTLALKGLIDLVLSVPGFQGEVFLAENHHYRGSRDNGWRTERRNGPFNLNELVAHYHENGHRNVSGIIWRDGGPNPEPLEGDDGGNGVVEGPAQGDGYVWRDDLIYTAPNGRRVMMTYPIFTSPYSGVRIDFRNGAWEKGDYTDQPIRFFSFSQLNHHGCYAGVTAAVKHYMGIVDMTCGYQGTVPVGFHNTHFVGMYHDRYPWRVIDLVHRIGRDYLLHDFHYTGGALGYFMRSVRTADLHLIDAEHIGCGSRTDPAQAAHTNAVLAAHDPVALDAWATANLLLPATRQLGLGSQLCWLNDPRRGPLGDFLEECRRVRGGTTDPDQVEMVPASGRGQSAPVLVR